MSTAIDVRPRRAVWIFAHVVEFGDNFFAWRHANQRARPLSVERVTFRHAEGDHHEEIFGKVAEFFHEGSRGIFFAGEVNVRDVDEQRNIFSSRSLRLENVENFVPLVVGKSVTCRIVRGSVDNHEQRTLLFEERVDFHGEVAQVEIQRVVEKFERLQTFAGLVADDVVSAPTPIWSQNGVSAFGVVGNGVMNRARAAGSRSRPEISVRFVVGEGQINHGVEVSGKSANRRVGNEVAEIHRAENFFDGRKRRKFSFLVEHNADCRVGDGVRAVNFYCLVASLIRVENCVLELPACRVSCCHV